ncbi:MAG: ATP-binding cassette domain-containing protein [Caulobacteraceae bacterium]|nr:ATP-binding cassette domain-containing protein [Caulobacteraceae bacterium]
MSRTADGPGPPLQPAAASASPDDEAVVRFDGVGLRYGRAPEVLKDLSFSLQPGSFHFLTGASGAGKTSLLRLIQLAMPPSRGLVSLFGRDTTTLGREELPFVRRRIGVVCSDKRLLEHLNAFDNVALPLRLAGRTPADYEPDVAELLAWVGLADRMQAYPAALSGGEQQRLAIARAVVNRPEMLIADEPTGDVDHEMAIRILRLFVELNRLGATVLIASHDEELVARSGRPVMHLAGGRLTITEGANP